MKRTAYIVGTSHKFQFLDPGMDVDSHRRFGETLIRHIVANDIAGVAEECNEEALSENGRQETSVAELANRIGAPHKYCDPDRVTRKSLGILQENCIRVQAFIDDESEDQIQRKIRESYLKRETYWARELVAFNIWPVLYVCGANHVRSFVSVLLEHNIVGVVCESDWGARLAGSGK